MISAIGSLVATWHLLRHRTRCTACTRATRQAPFRSTGQPSAIRPGGRSQGRAGPDSIASWLSGLDLPGFGVRSELAQCGQRSEPSAAVDQPLGLLPFVSYRTCVAPHAQLNTATPCGTVAWLT